MKPCRFCKQMFQPRAKQAICDACAKKPAICEFCQTPFIKARPEKSQRFCSMSCKGKWILAQPKYRERLYTKARNRRISEFMRAWHQEHPEHADYQSIRMRLHNPQAGKKPATVRRVAVARRNNWETPPPAEAALLRILADYDPQWNVSFPTGTPTPPFLYTADVCLPHIRLIVEADGATHNALKARARDARKDAFLAGLGWTVLRFTNREILKRPHVVREMLLSTISTLKGATPTASAALSLPTANSCKTPTSTSSPT